MADMPPEVYPPSEQTYTSASFPRRLQDALLDLLRRFELSTDIARREYVKNCLKNHELFRGNAWRWWDYQTGTWRAYNSSSGGLSNVASTAEVQSLYSLNIFQGFALAFIALLSGNKMTVKWWPVNSRSPEDMEAAKKRDAVTRWWQANERTHTQLRKALYLLWCDGTIGSYVRTVADGDRFGYIEEPQIEIVERTFGKPAYKCVVCETPNEEAGACNNCGAPLPDEPNVPAPSARVPVQTGTKKIPKSRTVRSIAGGLELLLPPTCEEIWEFPYLIRRRELLTSTVRATFSELADKISGSVSSSGSAAAQVEKRARLQLTHGLTSDGRTLPVKTADYVTFSEVWFRRQAFYELDDKQLRDELVAMFPDGVYVSFAEDQFCEARAENLTEHWAICHALPGEGQIRQPIGGSTVQVQEILNDIFNLLRDHIEYGMPSTFVSNRVLDLRKWARSNVVAGAAYNVESPGNMSLRDAFFQTEPAHLPEFAVGFFNALRTDIPEFTSGVFRAAYGSHNPGNNMLDVDEPIPTPGGFVRNGDLKDGDKIFGEDGKVYEVVRAHPIKEEKAYRLLFDDGSSVCAHDGHRWFTATTKEREQILNRTEERLEYQREHRKKRLGLPPGGPLGKTGPKRKPPKLGDIRTTKEIIETLLDKRGRANHAIPVAVPFEGHDEELPLDPYVLGVWLGDGATAGGVIAASDEDGAFEAVEFQKVGLELKRLKSPFTWYAKGLRTTLGRIGLLGNKRIPSEYLWASRETRLALLQGLMDTDGCATLDGKQFFCNTNRDLIDGVYHLAASLGCKPRIFESPSNGKPFLSQSNGKTYIHGYSWIVKWTSPLNVFRLPRKTARVRLDTVAKKRNYRYIVAVEEAGVRPMRCITTSNPSTLYLFGKNFNVTGNTAQGMSIERDAALGRIAPVLRALTEHWADVATLVVNDFRKNALEPIAVVSRDQIGDFKTDVLRREDLDIGDAKTFPELDEDYPTTFPQKQSLLLQLMANPLFQPVLTALSNADLVRKTLGHELQVPGEAQYRHAFRTIRDLLGESPAPGQPQPVIGPDGQTIFDPNTGQPAMQPGPPESTVMLDALDDAAVNLMAAIDFAFSEDGERAKAANPDGYQNFLLWVEANQAKIQSGATNALTPPPPPMPPPATPQPPADGNQAQAVQ